MKDETKQWWSGETERQVERRNRALQRPIRSALIASSAWFLPMWAATGFSFEPIVLVLWVAASLAFGFGLLWFAKRKATRR